MSENVNDAVYAVSCGVGGTAEDKPRERKPEGATSTSGGNKGVQLDLGSQNTQSPAQKIGGAAASEEFVPKGGGGASATERRILQQQNDFYAAIVEHTSKWVFFACVPLLPFCFITLVLHGTGPGPAFGVLICEFLSGLLLPSGVDELIVLLFSFFFLVVFLDLGLRRNFIDMAQAPSMYESASSPSRVSEFKSVVPPLAVTSTPISNFFHISLSSPPPSSLSVHQCTFSD